MRDGSHVEQEQRHHDPLKEMGPVEGRHDPIDQSNNESEIAEPS